MTRNWNTITAAISFGPAVTISGLLPVNRKGAGLSKTGASFYFLILSGLGLIQTDAAFSGFQQFINHKESNGVGG